METLDQHVATGSLNSKTLAMEGYQKLLHFLNLEDKPVDHVFNGSSELHWLFGRIFTRFVQVKRREKERGT